MTEHVERPPLTIVGAPSSAGAYGPGQEQAPAAFRRHGLVAELSARGVRVRDRGDGPLVEWRRDPISPSASNADLVTAVAADLADRVAAALADDDVVLALGGDCTVELGTVAGAIRDGARVGLAYIDLDADLNTPATGDGILDWMGVAHLLDVPGAHDGLASLAGRRPMLEPAAVRLFAVDNITAAERAVIDRLDIAVETLTDVRTAPGPVAERARGWAREFDRLLVHVDVDVLDYEQFPIAENTRLRPGLALPELGRLLSDLCALPQWRALTVTEVNPAHAPDEHESFTQLVQVLADALAPTR